MAYGKVQETFWDDDKVRTLSRNARELMQYLLTCRHKNRLGCYVLKPGYAAEDLRCRDWEPTIGEIEEAIRELERLTDEEGEQRIYYDWTHRVLFIRHFLRHNVMANHKVVTAALSDLAGLPDTSLFPRLLQALEENSRPHYQPLIEALRNRIANRSGNGMGNGIGNGNLNGMPYRGTAQAEAEAVPEADEGANQTSCHPPDTGGHEVGFSSLRERDRGVIREVWHLGREEVEIDGKTVGMGLEMTIRDALAQEWGEEVVSGALPHVRAVEEFPADQPISLRLPEQRREVMERMIAYAGQLARRDDELPPPRAAPLGPEILGGGPLRRVMDGIRRVRA